MLPPDPCVVRAWEGSRGTFVTFSSYKSNIWYTDALNAILEAGRLAAIQIYIGNGDRPIGRSVLHIFGSITLNFNPRPNLTWRTWNLVLSVFASIYDKYEYTGFSFKVDVALSPAGTGFLGVAAIATPQATPQAA